MEFDFKNKHAECVKDNRQNYVRNDHLLVPIEVAARIALEADTEATESAANEEAVSPHANEELHQFVVSIKDDQLPEKEVLETVRKYFPFPICYYLFLDVPHMELYSADAIHARYAKLPSLTSDSDERCKKVARLDALRTRGVWRELKTIGTDWREKLDLLEENHPNFSTVVSYLRGVFAVAERGDGVPRPANILLNGPPGCGKTYFAKHLAACFDTEFHAIHLESIQTAGEIIGDSDSYRNAAPGMLYNFLTNGKVGNPVILLDEICKVGGDDRFNPSAALLRVLEKETAAAYADNAENWCTLDLSKVFFVATSNNLESISLPVRSRLKTFEIAMPKDPDVIIKNIFAQIVNADEAAFNGFELTVPAVDVLAAQAPRRIRQLIEDALGKALFEGRTHVLEEDVITERVKAAIGFA